MGDHHIIKRDGIFPELRVFASPDVPRVYMEISDGALSTAFHLTRYQTAQLIAALHAVDNELAAREVERVSA